ncbi:hypothetical protein [Actinoplanes sp. NPDC051851]|uniref:hypothetical protein n=1 Tax=Actinoplanes sp. NPDC051851 TaxID=3154753 RepID=UPI0034373B03
MKQIRDSHPHEMREYPATPEEFAAVQRRRLLQAAGADVREDDRRRIDVALTGSVTVDHVVGLATLGPFLTNFQESVSAVAQALSGRPTNSAAIPREIRDATVLSAAAIFPSSFGLTIFGPPVEPETESAGVSRVILDEAVEKLLAIIDISEGGDLTDELLTEQLVPLGPRSIKHIRALTAGLDGAGVGVRVSWHVPGTRVRRSVWTGPGVQRVRFLCEHSEFDEVETIPVTGLLVSASSLRGRIEIRTDSGDVIQAVTGDELTAQLGRYFDKRVTADVEVTSVTFAGGREHRIHSVQELRLA